MSEPELTMKKLAVILDEFTDGHPSAEDYRNRAERAEQEAAELREVAEGMAAALKEANKWVYGPSAREKVYHALAAYTAHMIR